MIDCNIKFTAFQIAYCQYLITDKKNIDTECTLIKKDFHVQFRNSLSFLFFFISICLFLGNVHNVKWAFLLLQVDRMELEESRSIWDFTDNRHISCWI